MLVQKTPGFPYALYHQIRLKAILPEKIELYVKE
jgi:hypothetical protein